MDTQLLQKAANTLRFLAVDMVERAKSGHPGAAMGLADVVAALSLHLRHYPREPRWLNRDRLVFSGGHCSALLYSFLHLCGYKVSLEDLKSFRQLGAKTPGHPEFGHTEGVEITTGPLGQGVANAVGFAMAAKRAANLLGKNLINHRVFCLCGDGDLEEGLSYEACSLAGRHRLENLVLIYDCNGISIEGEVGIAFNENVAARFKAQGWAVRTIDGHNFLEIDAALKAAKKSTKPFLIIAKTTIAKGALELENSHKAHGAPLGSDLVARAKAAAGFSGEFSVPSEARFFFESALEMGEMHYKSWLLALEKSKKKALLEELLNPRFAEIVYPKFDKAIATRASNGEILNAIAANLKGFLGGSADLAPSNNTHLKNSPDFPEGANLHFGIREHAMGAITNAFAAYGLFLPFCATFFVFSDYLSASVRLAALSRLKVLFIFTHDSIGVGEDGATHQPIEHLSHLRSIPNLLVFRPADANENIACMKIALTANLPSAFVLSRQNLGLLEGVGDCQRGAYILKDSSNPKIVLCASGSEVHLALSSAAELKRRGVGARVVSVPCFDLLLKQDSRTVEELFCGGLFGGGAKILAIEAARGLEWHRFAHKVISMQDFGASGKGEELFLHFGFALENVVKTALEMLG